MKKHLLRKSPCPSLKENLSNEELWDCMRKCLDTQLLVEADDHRFCCATCDKSFTSGSALSRHRLGRCKTLLTQQANMQQQLERLMEEHNALKKRLEDLPNVQQNNCHNTNTINNTQVIIAPFGKEDVSHILEDKSFMERCLRRRELGVIDYLKRVHFDPQKPEHRNIRVPNLKLPWMDAFDGEKWIKKNKEEVLDDMLDTGTETLDSHYYEHKEELAERLSETMISLIEDFIDKVSNRDQETHTQLFQDLKRNIYLMVINESR